MLSRERVIRFFFICVVGDLFLFLSGEGGVRFFLIVVGGWSWDGYSVFV